MNSVAAGDCAEPAAGYYTPVRDTTLRVESRAGEESLVSGLLNVLILISNKYSLSFWQSTVGKTGWLMFMD